LRYYTATSAFPLWVAIIRQVWLPTNYGVSNGMQ
jgi:hypothetical protein